MYICVLTGQHDDARMNIAIAISAARMGGTMTNYTEVVKLHKTKDASGKEVVCGARVKDRQTGGERDGERKGMTSRAWMKDRLEERKRRERQKLREREREERRESMKYMCYKGLLCKGMP